MRCQREVLFHWLPPPVAFPIEAGKAPTTSRIWIACEGGRHNLGLRSQLLRRRVGDYPITAGLTGEKRR